MISHDAFHLASTCSLHVKLFLKMIADVFNLHVFHCIHYDRGTCSCQTQLQNGTKM